MSGNCRPVSAVHGRLPLVVLTVLVCFVAWPIALRAQVNGFASVSYGSHANPLYNYERIPDHVRQGYLELQYQHAEARSGLSLGYVGGLMVFSAFTDRNYYEHRGRIAYTTSFGSLPSFRDASEVDDSNEEEPLADRDSTLSYLEMAGMLGARHDKEVFQEFDNTGTGLLTRFRFRLGPLFMRIENDAGYRRYTHLPELSNITESLTLQLGRRWPGGGVAGIQLTGGVKRFTTDTYDTTRFEPIRTFIEKSNGKGKGGAKLIVPSDKQILIDASTTTTWQFGAGVFGGLAWNGATLTMDMLYRYNPGEGTRYLAHYANTSILSEDIYNDYFSSDGPLARLRYSQTLPFRLQAIVTLDASRKRFGAPALSLDGEKHAENRVDIHSSAELWLSRYIEMPGGIGLDLAFSASVVRNQSNDDYNDFSLVQIAASLGVGF